MKAITINIDKKTFVGLILALFLVALTAGVIAPQVSHRAEAIIAGMFGQEYAGNWSFMNGSVGIGTETPSHELNVVGDLNVTGDIYTNASSLYLGDKELTNDLGTLKWGGADVGGGGTGLGVWQSTISENTIYQAATDGFVVGMIRGTANQQGLQRIQGYTDSNTPPTTLRGYASITGHSAAQWPNGMAGSFTMPVKKDDYYRVTKTDVVGSLSSTRTYYWISLN